MKRNSGFTLIETLVVLVVISFFIGLPTLSINNWLENVQRDQTVAAFENSFLKTQQMAIISMQETSVQILDSRKIQFCNLSTARDNVAITVDLPTGIFVEGPKVLKFKAGSGNPSSKIIKYQFTDEKSSWKLILQTQIGSGRFVKKEY